MPDFIGERWIHIGTSDATVRTQDTTSYQQYCEEVYAAQYRREQQMREDELRAAREAEERCYQKMKEREEDKKKYPLFFLKEGIV